MEEENKEEKVESQSDSENKEINNQDSQSGEAPNQVGLKEGVSSNTQRGTSEGKVKDNDDKVGERVEEAKVEEKIDDQEEKAPKEEVKEVPIIPKSKEGKKEGSWTPMVIVMGLSLVIAFAWDKVDIIKNSVHAVLNPSAGALLNLNPTNPVLGMLIIVLIISLATTLIQKYATDQDALRELKKEQKILQAEMKKYKDDPARVAELSKKQFQFIPKTFKLTSRGIMYTGVPFILFFRWFTDTFTEMEAVTGVPIRFFGFLTWFWFYLIFTMVFSSFLRKWMKVV